MFNEGEAPESFLDRQARQKAKGINGNGMGLPLSMAAKMWPTARATDTMAKALRAHVSDPKGRLEDVVALWPTPLSRDGKGANQGELIDWGNCRPLNEVAAVWRTPTRCDAERGVSLGWNIDARAGEHSLRQQTALWPTPTVGDVTGGHASRSADRKDEPLLNGLARALSSLPALATYQVGQASSPERRSLNPLFVEWLMGWPPGWTLLGWTDFACSATELSRFKARMRSALSQLASPPEAPPEPYGLFG